MLKWNKRKVLSFVLAVLVTVAAIPFSGLNSVVLASNTQEVTVLHKGAEIEELLLAEDGEEILTASLSGISADEYRWQLCLDEAKDLWVTVNDRTGAECKVNYALVKSSLDSTHTASVRCVVTSDGKDYTSPAVKVQISYNVPQSVSYELGENPPVNAALYSVAAAAEEGGETLTEYIVRIIYLHEDGTDAATYYTAEVQPGADLVTTVEVPVVTGYQPTYHSTGETGGNLYQDQYDSKWKFEIKLSNITSDIDYRVTYIPALTTYKIVHHLQELSSEQYSTTYTDLRQGPTGSLVTGDLHKSGDKTASNYDPRFEGYSHLAYQRLAIAADGNTEIHIYYNRNYYTVLYDLSAEGYGTSSLVVRYGTEIYPKTPTRPGYDFGGWELVGVSAGADFTAPTDAEKALYDLNSGSITVPAFNLQFRAVWNRGDSSYTVVYWKESPTGSGYEYWGSVVHGYTMLEDGNKYYQGVQTGDTVKLGDHTTVPAEVAMTTEHGKTFDESVYFVYNKTKTEEAAGTEFTVEGDGTTVVNIYYDRQKYELKFYYAASSRNTYYVIGGSTYYFGADATSNTSDDEDLFTQYLTNQTLKGTHVGQVDKLPTLKTDVASKYKSGTTESNGYTLYWISFTAKYGADIGDKWPVDVFNPVNRKEKPAASSWTKDVAYASAWNGEHNVWYSQNNGNQTIKGKYSKLDFRILWDPVKGDANTYADTSEAENAAGGTVAYLCFWENGGANVNWSVPELYRYNIWIECIDQTNQTANDTHVFRNGKWYALEDTYDTVDNSSVAEQTDPAIEGYKFVGKDSEDLKSGSGEFASYNEAHAVNFFYDRYTYELKFNNNGEYLPNQAADGSYMDHLNIRYGVSLYREGEDPYNLGKIYDTDGTLLYYPENLDPNGYEFKGWYSSPTFATGTEFTFSESTTMPAHDLEIYAYWALKEHKVWVYANEEKAQLGQKQGNDPAGYAIYPSGLRVTHGSIAETPPDPQPTDGKVFNGWYYRDSEGEHRWLFNMPVEHEMHIYAKYISNIAVKYTVEFVLLDYYNTTTDGNGNEIKIPVPKREDGVPVKVADDVTAYGISGTHITVYAKTGNELYNGYTEGYFPEPITQDLTLSVGGENKKTVYYSEKEVVPYRVEYRYADTKEPVMGTFNPDGTVQHGGENPLVKEVNNNTHTVVTENFVAIPGWLPDALQKSLTVSANAKDNVLIFYYSKSSATAMVQVIEYVETRTKDVFTEYGNIVYDSYKSGVNFTYTIKTLNGFDFDRAEINGKEENIASGATSITKTVDGTLLIEVYYVRKPVEYTIKHILVSNGQEKIEAETEHTGMHGETVYAYANSYRGYELAQDSSATRMLTLTAVFADDDPNVIEFKYYEQQVTLTYDAVGDEKVLDKWLTSRSELVNALSGTPNGSEPAGTFVAEDGTQYRFVGWYQNADCTVPVPAGWVVNNKLTPQRSSDIFTDATYYAKFEPALSTLTIKTEFMVGQGVYSKLEPAKTWIFNIKGLDPENDHINLTVTIHGKGSVTIVDLPVGEYQVEELSEWTWRYNMDENLHIFTLTSEAKTETFVPNRVQEYWLDGHDYDVNIFNGSGHSE